MFVFLILLLSTATADGSGVCTPTKFDFDNPFVHIRSSGDSAAADHCGCAAALYILWKDADPRCAAKGMLVRAVKECTIDDELTKNFTDTVAKCPCMKNEFNYTNPTVHARRDDVCACAATGYNMWKSAPTCEMKDKLLETVEFCGELMSEALKRNFTDTADDCDWSTCSKNNFNFTHPKVHWKKGDPCHCAAFNYNAWQRAGNPCAKKESLLEATRVCERRDIKLDGALVRNFTETALACPCMKNEFNFSHPSQHFRQGDACACAAFAYNQWKHARHCSDKKKLAAAVISCGTMMDQELRKNFTDTAAVCLCEAQDFNFDAPLSHKGHICSCAGFGYNAWKNGPHCEGKKLIETVGYCASTMSTALRQEFLDTATSCKESSICKKKDFKFENVSVHFTEHDPCNCAAVKYKNWYEEWKKTGSHCAKKAKLLEAVHDCHGPEKQLDDELKDHFMEVAASCLCAKGEFNFEDPSVHSRLHDACACAGLAYSQWKADPHCAAKENLANAVQFCAPTMDKSLQANFTNSAGACLCKKDDFNFDQPESHNHTNDVCRCAALGYRMWKTAPRCTRKYKLVTTVEACGQQMDQALKDRFKDIAADECICMKVDFNFQNASVHKTRDDPCQCAAEAYMVWQSAERPCDQKNALLMAPDACLALNKKMDDALAKNFTDTAECHSPTKQVCGKADFGFQNVSAHMREGDVCQCAAKAYMTWQNAAVPCDQKGALLGAAMICEALHQGLDEALAANFTDTAAKCDSTARSVCRKANFNFENVSVHESEDDICQCAAREYLLWLNANPRCNRKDALLGAAATCQAVDKELDEALVKNFTDTAADCICRKEDFNFSNASVHMKETGACYCAAAAYTLWKNAPLCEGKDALSSAPVACKAMNMEMDQALQNNFTATAAKCDEAIAT